MTDPAEDGAMPSGHRQAANYHRSMVEQLERASLIVTMELPT